MFSCAVFLVFLVLSLPFYGVRKPKRQKDNTPVDTVYSSVTLTFTSSSSFSQSPNHLDGSLVKAKPTRHSKFYAPEPFSMDSIPSKPIPKESISQKIQTKKNKCIPLHTSLKRIGEILHSHSGLFGSENPSCIGERFP